MARLISTVISMGRYCSCKLQHDCALGANIICRHMRIFARVQQRGHMVEVEVDDAASVDELKATLAPLIGMPPHEMRIAALRNLLLEGPLRSEHAMGRPQAIGVLVGLLSLHTEAD
eukprot:SAG11_NODE_17271_length_523_cov_1.146226_1_plen_115_part_01